MLREPAWAYFRWLHNQADLNLCPSRFTQRQLLAQGFEQVKIWRRGVDHDRFSPRHRSQAWRERLSGGRPDAPLLLYVGRLALEKRVDWLRPVLDALPNVRLAIVGDGPSRPELEELLGGTATTFTGYLQGEDLAHAYASADIFVFPSASETFGNVVLEAMASALPVIVPRSGGPVDHVRHGENGFLFPSEDRLSLVQQAACLVADPALAQQVGARARAYARTQTWGAILDALLETLQGVLDDDRRRGDRPDIALHRNLPGRVAKPGSLDRAVVSRQPATRKGRWPGQNLDSTAWDRFRELLNQNKGNSADYADGTTPHSRHK